MIEVYPNANPSPSRMTLGRIATTYDGESLPAKRNQRYPTLSDVSAAMMSLALPYRSTNRPTNGDPKATMMPAGSSAIAIFRGDQPRADCRKIVIMNWKLR